MKSRLTIFHVAVWLLLAGLLAGALLAVGRGELWRPVGNSLLLAASVCVVALPVGALLAFLIVRSDAPGRNLAAVLLTTLLLVPLYLQVTGWEAVAGRQGWQTGLAQMTARPLLSGWRAVIWIHAVASIPWVTLIVGLGMRLADAQLEEEALLNATPSQVFWRVTLRRGFPSIAAAALWVLVTTTGEMTVANVYQVRNYAEALHASMALGDDPQQTWQGVLPGVLLTGVLLLGGILLAVRLAPGGARVVLARSRPFRLGRWRKLTALLLVAGLLLLVVVPLASLVWQSGKVTLLTAGEISSGWSAGKCLEMIFLNPPIRFGQEIGWTLLIGAVAATTTLLAAMPLAWLAKNGGWRSLPALLVCAVLLATPGPLIALGWLGLLASAPSSLADWLANRTILSPVVLTTVRALPLAVIICWYALRTVGRESLESAATEGASATSRFWRIAIAANPAAMATAWLVSLAAAMGDLTATANMLVMPPGVDTVSRRIFGLVHFGADDQLSGLALFSAGGFVLISACLVLLLRRLTSRR